MSRCFGGVDVLAGRIVVVDRGGVMASGTAAELKEQVGRELVELCPVGPRQVDAAADDLADLARSVPRPTRATSRSPSTTGR
jgi:hypothetical protein